MSSGGERWSAADPRGALLAWTLRVAVAEMLAIGLAGLVVGLWMANDLGAPWLLLGAMVLVGLAEGFVLARLPLPVARALLPAIDGWAFVRNTMIVAAGAWALGMLPSTLLETRSEAVPPPTEEPATWVLVLAVLLGGAVGGAIIGAGQWLAMRRVGVSSARWIGATAAAWSLGLGLDWLGASLPDEGAPLALVVLSGLGFGALAGMVVGVITGVTLLRIANDAPLPPRR